MSPDRRIRLIAHNIRSLWNIGSFFRSADASGVEHVYLTGYTARPPREEISKTALGAESWIPWSAHADVMEAVTDAKEHGYSIVSLELSVASTDIFTYTWPEKVCLVVGHEIDGVPDDVLNVSDAVLHIPMHGKKDSLNVSVAAGIAMMQARSA